MQVTRTPLQANLLAATVSDPEALNTVYNIAAGGRTSDCAGRPVDVRRGAVIASNGLVHDQLRLHAARYALRISVVPENKRSAMFSCNW